MPRTISVSEAKNKLSAVLEWAIENDDEVVVESRGQPKAVILPYADYEAYLLMRELEQRRKALQRMEELAKLVRELNADLASDKAEEIAEEISSETIARMVSEGKISFKAS